MIRALILAAAVAAASGVYLGLSHNLGQSHRADDAAAADSANQSACVPTARFSPDGRANELVDATIDSARRSIRLAGYTFTSRDVVARLVAAKARGVDVAVVVDERNNLIEDRSGRAREALARLVSAGIPTRTIGAYPIHHDKYMVIDGSTVQTGSFNYTESAATRNSENALVLWHCSVMAQAYLDHWQSRWNQGVDFAAR
ncbi:phospholipase D family protein [Burkholderia sp. Ac-20345]|nr:phospholipase D family protein [Burkholderia sp. Ac-20345]